MVCVNLDCCLGCRAGRYSSAQITAYYSVGDQQVLVLTGRIRAHGAEPEAVEAVEQLAVVLAVGRVVVSGWAGVLDAATVAAVGRPRVELPEGRVLERVFGAPRARVVAGVDIGGAQELAGRLEHVAVRELRVVGPVLEEVRVGVGGGVRAPGAVARSPQLIRGQRAPCWRCLWRGR